MIASTHPLVLLLLFLSTCHGKKQDESPPLGQKKVEAPLSGYCPEDIDIKPCECHYRSELTMDCSNVQDEEQLRKVFSSNFYSTDFHMFVMINNKGVKVLEDGVFGKVTFQEVIIKESALETVEKDALDPSLSILKYIEIEHCQLAAFPFERLPELTSLIKLSLNNNKIQSLPPLSSSNLHILDLKYNPISHFSPDVFTLLSDISYIYIDNCNLTEITPGTFTGIPKLQLFTISHNKISHLQSLSFDLVSSPSLDLGYNNIESVEVDAFMGLQRQSTVIMMNNALTTLKEEVWRPALERHIHVYLQGNSLSCGCDVAWLIRNPDLLLYAEFGRCADGTLLTDLDPADFDICG